MKVDIWVKVNCISCEGSKLYVKAILKKTRSREAYEVLTDGVSVEKFSPLVICMQVLILLNWL